jgi:hypothetical protein
MVAYIVGAEHLNSHKLHKFSGRNLALFMQLRNRLTVKLSVDTYLSDQQSPMFLRKRSFITIVTKFRHWALY